MREKRMTSAYRIRWARSFMMLLLCVVVGTLILAERCAADTAEPSRSGRIAMTQTDACDRAVMLPTSVCDRVAAANGTTGSNAASKVTDETRPDTEPVEATPTPVNQQDVQNRKNFVMEKYALGVILASGITIGMLIVLFLYWNRKTGGNRF